MTRKHNIIIVGNGLFGSIAAAHASSEGHNVTIIAERRKYEASAASGCVLAPSWMSSLDKATVSDSMNLLTDLYPVHDIEFQTNLLAKFKAKRINPEDVLLPPDINARVLSVGDGVVKYEGGTLRGTVLVAAGIWCGELLSGLPPIRGLYGASLRSPGQLATPLINVYAPYRQAVGFNIDRKTVWFGDGTALIAKTWDKEERDRVQATIARARSMGVPLKGNGSLASAVVGARPYVEGHKAGYFQKVSPKTYVSTGGAKNGTILAAAQALAFVESLR